MSDINALIPKKIKLVVNKGQDLCLFHPKKILKNQPQKWRVLFLGVVEKLATAKVESDTGNPEWLCEIAITAKNAQDPISLLVTDSKGRHIGQVVIPLNQIPARPTDCPPGTRPPLVFSNIHISELEPTHKNAYPKGYLYYWMWTEDYWKVEELLKMKTKKSLSRSMHDLSNSTLNLFRRKKSTISYQESEISPYNIRQRTSTDVSLRASPLKINNLKKKTKPGSDSSSSMNSQNILRPGTVPNSPLHNGFYSTNPFDLVTTTDISIESHIKQEEPYQASTSHNHQSSLQHQVSIKSKESPAPSKPKHGLFSKFRFKKSQSSTDLTNIVSTTEHLNVFHPLPQSLGKQQGQRLFEKKNEFCKSSADIPAFTSADIQISNNGNNGTNTSTRRMNRPQSCLVHATTDHELSNKTLLAHYPDQASSQDYRYKCNTINCTISPYCVADMQTTNRNREDMSRRELTDLITYLEVQLKATTERCRGLENESDKLIIERKELHSELSNVKDELCRLKLRLLEAGETKYLEKTETQTRGEVLSDLALWRANSNL